MIFHVKSKAHPSLETVALADVVINLFIFFFVTFGLFATFDAAQKGIVPIELPKAEHAEAKRPDKPLVILINRKGDISLGVQATPVSKLHEALNHELSFRKDKAVIVHADRTIPLEKLVSVLDVVRNTKARSVSIETEFYSPPSGSK